MKKIIAMILSTILLFAAVPAYAEDVVEITAEVQVFTVGISVKTTLSGRLTLKVYNPEKDTLLHIWQENVYEAKEDGNVYTFDSFDLDTDAETGKYHVVINDTFSAEFLFVNSKDKGAFYKSLALATADELELVLKNGADGGIVDFDLKGYFDYSDDVKDNINAGIEALELPVPGENPTEEELKAFAEVFEPEMERLLCAAELVTADAENFAKVVSETAEIFDLDLTYYSDEKLDMDPEWVQKRMSTLNLPSFDTEDVQKAFDTAMLLAMIDEVGYATVTKALSHYNGGCIDLNTEITEDFSDSQMNNVSRKLKQNAASLENAKDIEEAYEAYAEEIAEDAESGSSGGGGSSSSGGGSSSSGGGGGGGSTGGNRKPSTGTETKPEDSKPSVTFSDINEIPWAKESILYLASEGVISGKGDGKFYPGDTVTREEFVKIIV
ncbi:MAG: S-layer homology domain-containing protein, partial [Clostridia bacterium]|nr:S-layer homology domain-containing protein [Clostridia bacterium]